MFSVGGSGDFGHLERFLTAMEKGYFSQLDPIARLGQYILASATPYDDGSTANNWGYEIDSSPGRYEIVYTNNEINRGVNVAIILQYGHGTGTGGWVEGRDYINPATLEIIQSLANEAWKVVIS